MPPVPSSCKAINRSTSLGPRRTRASPSATASRIMPEAARSSSFTADRLLEQGLVCDDGLQDRPADVQTVNLEMIAFDARGQSPRLLALIEEKCVPDGTRLEGERGGDETGIQ